VNKVTPVITWANPADITYGTALSATQLNATAPVPGTFAYTPAAGTILNVGNAQTLSVTFTPTDTTNYTTAPATASINVIKVTPTLGVTASANPSTYGQGVTFTANVTPATATGTIQFQVDGVNSGTPVALASGSATSASITTLTAGPHTITAVYSGDGNVFGATSAGYSQTVNKATPVITWATPADIMTGTALSVTQLNAITPVAGTLTYTPASGTVLPAGLGQTLTVNFTPTDAVNYNTTSKTVAINVMVYGDINRDGSLTIADALRYLQVSLHLQPAPTFMGNVLLAPIVGGVPTPGARTAVDVRDVSLVLQKIVGLW